MAPVLDRLPAAAACPWSLGSPGWPWSHRIAGAKSTWPAVEVYEGGALLDVVSSTRLGACVLRGARSLRVDGGSGPRAFAWGRLPPTGDLPVVEFSRGRLRRVRDRVPPVLVTSWCWMATAEGRFDTVIVRSADLAIRRRLQVSRSCR
jgi:hypothetical protein